ncbi:MAG: TolC family protein [Candidatus Cloacimonetes bacterium]|nr:TolC family protein [Candidatus Cloacimonadota bacterium]
MQTKLIIILLLLSSLLYAERTVSLSEAVEAALVENDALVSADYDLKSTTWDKYGTLSSFLPTASFSMSRLQLDPAPEYIDYMGNTSQLDKVQTTNSLQIVQPILTGGKRILGYFITQRLEQMAENQYASVELDTRNTCELKYMSLVEAYHLRDLARDDLVAMQNTLTITQVKYETGLTAEAEFLQIQSETAAREAALADAEMYYQMAAADLANFCNFSERILIPENSVYDKALDAVFEKADTDLLLVKLEALCLKQNLTLKTMEESVKLSKLNKMMALSDNLPSLNLIYEKSWEDDFDLDNEKDASTSLMLTASLPLLPFADTYCKYQSEHYQYKKAQRVASAAAKGMKLQVTSTILALQGALRKLRSSELAEQYAEQTYLQMEERYSNNLISASELLGISVMKQSSAIGVLQDQINLIRYKSELKKLLNLSSDQELINILINI